MSRQLVTIQDDETKNFIMKEMEEFCETIDKTIFLEAKDLMNKYFGEENNQISKPTIDDIDIAAQGFHSYINIDRIRGWDDYKKTSVYKHLNVYVRFPEVHIRNGRSNRGHIIKDLWVKFQVNNKFGPSNMQGARSYLSWAEANRGYHHSHLPSGRPTHQTIPIGFQYFCLGSGEILQSVHMLNDNFNNIDFSMFCLHLKNYVVWESIEGTPHIRYSTIGSSNVDVNPDMGSLNQLGDSYVNNAVKILKSKIAHLNISTNIRDILNPSIIGDDVTLEIDETLELFLGALISDFNSQDMISIGMDYRADFQARKNSAGEWVRARGSDPLRHARVFQPTEPIFEFKGKPIYLKIEGINDTSIQKQDQNNNIYAHPTVTKQFSESFRADFKEICFAYQENIQKNTLKNLFQTTGSNLLPV